MAAAEQALVNAENAAFMVPMARARSASPEV